MSDLFKKPIICELKPSYTLSVVFVLIALLPILALLGLFEKHPWLVISVNGTALIVCVFYLRQYALRINRTSVINIRLHRGQIITTQKNQIKNTYRLKMISLAPEWIIFTSENNKKILIDKLSTDLATYSAIRRQIKLFDPNQ